MARHGLIGLSQAMDSTSPQPAASGIASIGVHEARAHLSDLLDRVQRGERIIITRHGKPVARLVPEEQPDQAATQAALDRLFARRDAMAERYGRFTHEELMAMRDEGRRQA